MPMVLAQNRYGKAETRVVRVRRDAERHEVDEVRLSLPN